MSSQETFTCRVELCQGPAIDLQLGPIHLRFTEQQFGALAGFLAQCAEKLAVHPRVQRSTVCPPKKAQDGTIFQWVR